MIGSWCSPLKLFSAVGPPDACSRELDAGELGEFDRTICESIWVLGGRGDGNGMIKFVSNVWGGEGGRGDRAKVNCLAFAWAWSW